MLAFVEVKTRRTRAFGSPGEAVTRAKAGKIRRLATRLLVEETFGAPTVRFDVVEVVPSGPDRARITHIEGAF